MKMKRIAAIVLAGAMTLSMAACGAKADNSTTTPAAGNDTAESVQEAGTEKEAGAAAAVAGALQPNSDPANTEVTDETLKIGMASEPSTLWCAAAGKTENEAQIIQMAMLDTLVSMDRKTGEVLPNLASAWEWVDDTHCKFTLRDDVTMSDGTPLVADDVVYSIGVWMSENATNDTGSRFVGAVADDEHTVTIEFNVVAPDLVSMLSWSNFGIASEEEVTAAGGLKGVMTNPVIGSGKYKFKEWKTGQSITLERNDNYWNDNYKGYFKEIVFTFTNDAAAREMAVESKDADVAYDMPISQAATFAQSDKVSTVIYSFGQVIHLWYNMGENGNATKDEKVRAAIDKALNFDAIAQVGTAGFGKASLAYMDKTTPVYTENYTAEERAVDVEGAKALLEEAGFASGLELKIIGLQDLVPVLTVIQANLAEVGIKLTIDTPDTAQFVEGAFGGNYDLICVGDNLTVRTPDIVPFLQKMNIDGPGMVIGGPKYTTDEIDTAIAELVAEVDAAKAKEKANAIDTMVKEQLLCSSLYSEMKASVIAKDLKGYTTIERGYLDVTNFYR